MAGTDGVSSLPWPLPALTRPTVCPSGVITLDLPISEYTRYILYMLGNHKRSIPVLKAGHLSVPLILCLCLFVIYRCILLGLGFRQIQ